MMNLLFQKSTNQRAATSLQAAAKMKDLNYDDGKANAFDAGFSCRFAIHSKPRVTILRNPAQASTWK